MAIGFPAYHEDRVYFADVSGEELMDAMDAAFRRLGWSANETGRWSFRASTGMSFMSWGNTVTARVVGEGELAVRCECVNPLQWIDWGTNSTYIDQFVRKLEDLLRVRARQARERD